MLLSQIYPAIDLSSPSGEAVVALQGEIVFDVNKGYLS